MLLTWCVHLHIQSGQGCPFVVESRVSSPSPGPGLWVKNFASALCTRSGFHGIAVTVWASLLAGRQRLRRLVVGVERYSPAWVGPSPRPTTNRLFSFSSSSGCSTRPPRTEVLPSISYIPFVLGFSQGFRPGNDRRRGTPRLNSEYQTLTGCFTPPCTPCGRGRCQRLVLALADTYSCGSSSALLSAARLPGLSSALLSAARLPGLS